MRSFLGFVLTMTMAVWMQAGYANEQVDYERRVGSELAMLFQSLDRDRNAVVSIDEAQGDLNFIPLFDDIDVNRNGSVTGDELNAYLELRYGPHASDAASQALVTAAETSSASK